MAYNCKVELNGNLGTDAKVIEKDGKSFVALSVATRDSYPKKEGDNTVWIESKTTLWHEVLVFRPYIFAIAKDLKKGSRVEVIGTLSYRPFKDQDGHTQHKATIIAGFVRKVEFDKTDTPTDEEISKAIDEVAKG